MPAELKSHSQGRTMVLTLYNPTSHNALDTGVYAAGVEALNAAGDNPDIRSVVIVGSGDTFSAATDRPYSQPAGAEAVSSRAEAQDALHLFIDTVDTFPKPVLAAVEGLAAGAGFSLALACDMLVASRTAVFELPQARWGLPPDGGATWHLARALPRNITMEIALLGDRWDAERLYTLGIVNRLSAPGAALQDALLLAEVLNQRAPRVIEATKELLSAAPNSSLANHLAAERDQRLGGVPNAGADANGAPAQRS
ncbi:enoyl-CoA hydratase [Xylophilus sp. Kf1]|nr:enoyl-CoA hydratase [Xylophilus sp. Kf1]